MYALLLTGTRCITNDGKRKLLFNCYGERYCDIVATRWLCNYSSRCLEYAATNFGTDWMESTFLCEPGPKSENVLKFMNAARREIKSGLDALFLFVYVRPWTIVARFCIINNSRGNLQIHVFRMRFK